MNIDWITKLRHMLQVMAFCLVIATVQYAFQPEKPYGPPMVYSLFIGITTWAIIDFGRHLLPCEAHGWPAAKFRYPLIVAGIVAGYFFGNFLGDTVCLYYGLYPAGYIPSPASRQADFRNSVLITLIAGTIGSYFFYSITKGAYIERQMEEARKHANESRLKLLETQLEPHMLFNTLANLRALIAVDPERAQVMLDHMIAYLRATLAASRSTTHTLGVEFERLNDYLELMSIRMGPRLKFTLDLPADLAQETVPALLLQPIVENSIKHGLEPKREGGEIRVTARRENGNVQIEVCDTGIGPADADAAARGYGTSHVKERLAASHGERASVDFAPRAEGGARTLIRYPSSQ